MAVRDRGIELNKMGTHIQQPQSSSLVNSLQFSKDQQTMHLSLCLPGLEDLISIDQLFVHQEVQLREIFSNVPNSFDVLTSAGQRLFYIKECTGETARILGGGHQNFEMVFVGQTGKDIIKVQGQPGFYGGFSCASILYVSENGDQKMGEVIQEKDGCQLDYMIKDAFGNPVLRIKGPQFGNCCWGIMMTGSVAFTIVSLDGKTILGGIGKLWGGLAREIFTMADNYGVYFPSEMDVMTKALLLGAVILLDFQHFERQ